MSLRYGQPMIAIPGPSITPERVLRSMNRSMPDIYEGELVDLAFSLVEKLPSIARTSGRVFMSISNGHGAWQMALCNTLSPGDKVLVLESGLFASVWGQMAERTQLNVEYLSGDNRLPVDPDMLEQRLSEDTSHEIKAILCVHTDTATSVRNDIAKLGQTINSLDHPALFMVDCIASLGCEQYEMDEWHVDITVAASQKGLMMPPGMAFVWASQQALEAHNSAGLRIGYFDWDQRMNPDHMYQLFCGTPPIQHLYGLREVLDMIDEEGLENIWFRHQVLADAVRAAVETWHQPDGLELNIVDPKARSNAVTTIRTGSIDSEKLRKICATEAGLTLGLAVGGLEADAFRIGHMGHLNPPMILGTLATIEAALLSMNASIGRNGIGTAAEIIAKAFPN